MIVYATKDHTHWLTIRNAQLNDGGIYTVKAVNEAGELAANAKLTVIGQQSLYLPLPLSVSLCLSLFFCLFLSLSISLYLSICLSVCLSIYLSICLSICLSI